MTDVTPQPSQYVVAASAQHGDLRQTWKRAASAAVPARSWIAAGHEAVRITDPSGGALNPERYRVGIVNGGRPCH
ncbi:hypothetical protein LOK46_04160 [Methylobacterium sp. NMS14P]|uniref:hypothetical protein n=1 Tax=Methylobacterium sp. NMS14P TaxID=2894310 RepID=UPI0023587E5E|nr:hypothetical protein [Methylobacterium sp. NMS14P]WCS26040.1 hypothetical protein LOK46_04160 [Methylobacterium sp. NMS14P]